jgi:hypothetical protein
VVNSNRVPSPDSQPTSYARTYRLPPGPEVIKIAVDHGVVAAVAAPMPAATRRTQPSRLEPKPRRRPLVSWAWATRISTGDPAGAGLHPDPGRRPDRWILDWLS